MAVWTDTDEFRQSMGEARSADFNKVLDNLDFLYNPPTCTVRLTADQEIASGSDQLIQWDEAAWDTTGDGMWDAGTPGTIVAPRDGVYLIVMSGLWETVADDASSRAFYLERNDQRLTGNRILSASAAEHQLTAITSVNEGDYFELIARHLSPTAIDLLATRTRCTVTWIRPAPDA